MGAKVTKTDFKWVDTEDLHISRRKEILKKHPEIKKYFKHDPRLKWIVVGVMLLQMASLPFIQQLNSWPMFLLLAYFIGAVLNHVLMFALHEIVHNHTFGHNRPIHNKLFGLFTNLPIGLPVFSLLRIYHLEHHRNTGDDLSDLDCPSNLEAKVSGTTGGKCVWLLFFFISYSLRPLVKRPPPVTLLLIANFILQIMFGVLICYFIGLKALLYLIIGSVLSMSVHPICAHFLSSHYVTVGDVETYSYYGPFNWISFNIGYDNEHHDFPNVAGRWLPEVKRLAPEFYDHLPHHTSWCRVMYDFITNPDVGNYSRVKRRSKTDGATDKVTDGSTDGNSAGVKEHEM